MFFVYLDWTLENAPRCFYVGKGTALRVKRSKRNKRWQNITNMYGQYREVIYSTSDEREAYAYEETIIAHYETYEGWGANMTPGGNTVMSGRNHTPVTKEKCRLGSLGNKNCVGRKASLATIAKISGSNHHSFGKKQSSDHIEKNRAANCGENNSQAKLTWAIVRDARIRFASGLVTKNSLAMEFNVSRTLIHYIIIQKLWKEKD